MHALGIALLFILAVIAAAGCVVALSAAEKSKTLDEIGGRIFGFFVCFGGIYLLNTGMENDSPMVVVFGIILGVFGLCGMFGKSD